MADLNKILVTEYLESLKESTELDNIFPILLEMLDYEVISKPTNARGQSQYGKDIVAIKEVDGVKIRFYFELKGGSDRNIDDSVLNKKDGVIESLRAAKNTPYIEKGIPGFDTWPARYRLVHNGILNENCKPTYNAFLTSEFKDGEFERWGIEKLAGLFSENLFNEYLLADGEENVSLFKKTLVLLDVPEYDLGHFHKLVSNLASSTRVSNPRYRRKFLSSLGLIATIIFHYCKSINNLDRAKKCIDHIVLKAWHWILANKFEKNPSMQAAFRSIQVTQLMIYHEYFVKTLPVAILKSGLYQERGGNYEEIGYSLRCTEYLNYLTYHIRLDRYFNPESDLTEPIKALVDVIENNSNGISRPLLDNQGVAYLNVFLLLMENMDKVDSSDFCKRYLNDIFDGLVVISKVRNRFPELHSNENALAEYIALGEKPYNYDDSSSTLILILFEMIVALDAPELYNLYRGFFVDKKIDLQTFYPDINDNTELLLFEREIKDEGYSETTIELPEKYDDFVEKIKAKPRPYLQYRTITVGYVHLKYLAHAYYKSPFIPTDWREFIFEKKG
jgi:hypothetical protein